MRAALRHPSLKVGQKVSVQHEREGCLKAARIVGICLGDNGEKVYTVKWDDGTCRNDVLLGEIFLVGNQCEEANMSLKQDRSAVDGASLVPDSSNYVHTTGDSYLGY